ncbi:MAG: hypothetical protein Tsb0034_21840 [Ekhidna sp.]
MFRVVTISVLISLCAVNTLHAQEDELSLAEQLAALESEMDSLSIFTLIDSLFNVQDLARSELNLRVGFTSSVTSAGRDYSINQTGISPGLAYYHKSGIYGDLSGFWNSGVTPSYNPTILSFGYLGTFNEKWSFTTDYEHWFYNPKDSSENLLTNSLGTSLSYDFKIGYASIDYTYLFGQSSAHRIVGGITGTLSLGKWWIFKSVNIYPSASMMFGNADITQQLITRQQLNEENKRRLELLINFSGLTDKQRFLLQAAVQRAFESGKITEQRRNELIIAIRNAEGLDDERVSVLQNILDEGYENSTFVDGNQFGLLNYAFTLPVSFSTDRWNIMLSYTYSVPVKLPDEFFEVDPIGYFAASISYRIPFK